MDFIDEYKEIIKDFHHYMEQEIYFESGTYEAQIEPLKDRVDPRNNLFMGVGSKTPKLLVVSNKPFLDSSGTMRCFTKDAGVLFTKMLSAMKIKKEQVYITNFYKSKNEIGVDYLSILLEQINILGPKIILILGRDITSSIFKDTLTFDERRGLMFNYQGIKTIITYHPEDLLNKNDLKKIVWADLQKVMRELDL